MEVEVRGPSILRSGYTQNLVVGFVCFCCPGIFNSLTGLGDAGGSDPTVASAMNATLYAVFAVCGFFGGTMYNIFGARILLCGGGLTYGLYSFGTFAWGAWGVSWFAILMAGLLGAGAAMLWT